MAWVEFSVAKRARPRSGGASCGPRLQTKMPSELTYWRGIDHYKMYDLRMYDFPAFPDEAR